MVGAGHHGAARQPARPPRRGAGAGRRAFVAAEGAPPAERLDAELIAAEALLLGHRAGRRARAHRRRGRPHQSAHHARRLGRVPARARPVARARGPAQRGLSRHRAERERVRAGGRALSGGGQPLRARPAGARGRRAVDRRSPPDRSPRRVPRARVASRPRRSGDRRWPSRRRAARASISAHPPTPTTRWCSGWSTPRCCPTCWRTNSCMAVREAVLADVAVVFVTPPAGELRLVACAGGDSNAARTLATAAATGQRLRRAADRGAPARHRSRGPAHAGRGVGAAVERPGPAARAHDGGRGAAGLRPVRGARASRRPPASSPASARSSRCSRASSARRRRCSASSSRCSACRATTSPCSSPARAAPARSWWRAPFTSARCAAPPPSCPTTARPPRANSPTASCSAIGAARSPARSTISPGSSAPPPAARSSSTRSAICRSTCSPSCCASSSRARSCRSATPSPSTSTCACVAATNADLEQRVSEGKFREDLYYRLSVIRIHIPPLRQRRDEIPHMATFFLREAADRLGKPDVQLSPEVLSLFASYWWPGNVRQLRNEVQRAVALAAPGQHGRSRSISRPISPPRRRVGPDGAPQQRRRSPPAAGRPDAGESGRRGGTRPDRRDAGQERRQHRRIGSHPRTDPARAVSEAQAARPGSQLVLKIEYSVSISKV